MTRDDFLSLPVATQVRIMIELLKLDEELAPLEKPRTPRPPKFDMRVPRSGGYQYASEMDHASLVWWHNRFTESAAKGTKYSEKDGARATKLAYWVAWREVAPDARWTGQRNDTAVTAQPPAAKPKVHEWEPRGQMPLTPQSDADDSAGGDMEFPGGW